MISSLSDDEIEDRYFLLGRMEILSVLNELIHRREGVSVYFNEGKDFFLTTLLEACPDALIFDLSGDPNVNQRLPKAASCIFVAQLNGIRVQFASGQPQQFCWGGSNAFRVALPERIVRVQRRESYRILLPVAKPLMLNVYAEQGGILGEWPAHDLSVGGLSFTVVGNPHFALDQEITRVTLALPKQSIIDSAARIRHITPLGDRLNSNRHRVGMAFTNLAPAMEVMIQRYITRVEHQRRALSQGIAAI